MNDGAIIPLNQAVVPADVSAQALQAAIGSNDLSQLSPEQKMKYLAAICNSTGLNALTQPFAIMKIDGKDVLYARAECAAQLRKLHKVNVKIVSRESRNGCYMVTVAAKLQDGIEDEAIGVVPIIEPMQLKEWVQGSNRPIYKPNPRAGQEISGLEYANAVMKAETKAKRRVTLSICGLGFIDESEIEDIRRADAPGQVVDQARLNEASATLGAVIDAEPVEEEPAKPAQPVQQPKPTPAQEKPKPKEKPAAPAEDLFKAPTQPTPAAEAPPATAAPAPPQSEPAPAAATNTFKNADGTLVDAVVAKIQDKISSKDDPMAETTASQQSFRIIRYLVAKGKLKKGDRMQNLEHTAANYIISKPFEALWKLVEEWEKTQPAP